MKSNNPITVPHPVNEGETILLDRLCCNICISPIPSDSGVKNAVILTVKKCSADGHIDNSIIKSYIFSDIADCKDENVLKVFAGFETLLTELFDKEGL